MRENNTNKLKCAAASLVGRIYVCLWKMNNKTKQNEKRKTNEMCRKKDSVSTNRIVVSIFCLVLASLLICNAITIEFNDASNKQVQKCFCFYFCWLKFETARNENKYSFIVKSQITVQRHVHYPLHRHLSNRERSTRNKPKKKSDWKKNAIVVFWCLNSKLWCLFFQLDASIAFKLSDKSHLVCYKWNSTDEALIKSVCWKCIYLVWIWHAIDENEQMKKEANTHTHKSTIFKVEWNIKLLAHERIAGMIMLLLLRLMLHRWNQTKKDALNQATFRKHSMCARKKKKLLEN